MDKSVDPAGRGPSRINKAWLHLLNDQTMANRTEYKSNLSPRNLVVLVQRSTMFICQDFSNSSSEVSVCFKMTTTVVHTFNCTISGWYRWWVEGGRGIKIFTLTRRNCITYNGFVCWPFISNAWNWRKRAELSMYVFINFRTKSNEESAVIVTKPNTVLVVIKLDSFNSWYSFRKNRRLCGF